MNRYCKDVDPAIREALERGEPLTLKQELSLGCLVGVVALVMVAMAILMVCEV